MTVKRNGTIGPIVETIYSFSANSMFFTVNTAVDNVSLLKPSVVGLPANSGYLQNAIGNKGFLNGECVTVLSCGLVVPEGFLLTSSAGTIADIFKFKLSLQSETPSNNYTINNFDALGLPYANYEYPLGDFIEPKKAGTVPGGPFLDDNFNIIYTTISPDIKVSMLNVPAIYNAKTFYCPFFIKVQHTYQMIA